MHYLITGGAGFIWLHLAEAFLDRGDPFNIGSTEEVTILDLARIVLTLVDTHGGVTAGNGQKNPNNGWSCDFR